MQSENATQFSNESNEDGRKREYYAKNAINFNTCSQFSGRFQVVYKYTLDASYVDTFVART